MASLTEILILRGVVPIENLDTISGSWGEDEEAVKQLVDRGMVTPVQLASARAAQADLPFVELVDFPVERTAVALVPATHVPSPQRASYRPRRRHPDARDGRPGQRLRD